MKKQAVSLNPSPLIAIVAVSFFLFFWQLGATHLTNWDEAWYADISRTMAGKGNIFSPTWNGRLFLEKPPLSYWLTALSYWTFGDSEFSARFISALSAVGTVLLVFWFMRRRWGMIPTLVSSFVLLSTPAYLWRARTGDLDSLLTLLLTAEIIVLMEIFQKRRMVWFAGIIIALAFLTKGSIAFIFPIIVGLYYLMKSNNASFISTLWAIILGAFVSALWLSVMYLINGQSFFTQFFAQQGEKVGSPLSLISYFSLDIISYLRSGLKFWIIPAAPSILALAFHWHKLKESVIALCAIVFIILLSFLKVKSSWFLMPVYPLFAISVGWAVYVYGKKYTVFIVCASIALTLFQLRQFRSDYFVPDVSRDEALVAIASTRYTKPSDGIYLTHYYYPTAVYYSRRTTYAVYSDHPSPSWWILSKDQWSDILKKDRVFINTDAEDVRYLQSRFPNIHFEVLFQSGDKLLVSKV